MPQSVTELVTQIKRAVEQQVGEQSVVGEIGSCKAASSGHIYFTLKDRDSQLSCVLYRFQAASCRVRLREGMQVELRGRATVWEGRGSLQFTVSHVKEAGQGSLQQQFEALKAKLMAEGLFSQERKKPLPSWPQSVGLITSPTGAVIEDMRHRLEARAPWIEAYLLPVQVQGAGAEIGLARAIDMWGEPEKHGLPRVDYLILARGGGSLEDLWCFNEEILARAIAQCPIPIISAVGHETDFSIADFVSDLRAPTPTAAIELSTPNAPNLREWIEQAELTMKRRLHRTLELAQLRMSHIEKSRLSRPEEALAGFYQQVDEQWEAILASGEEQLQQRRHRLALLDARISHRQLLQVIAQRIEHLQHQGERMQQRVERGIQSRRERLERLDTQLRAASPQNALDRGFALVTADDGRLLRNPREVEKGESVTMTLKEGSLRAEVTGEGQRVIGGK